MSDQEWVKAAMSNDSMVVELLVSITNPSRVKRLLPLDWTVRQPRSKSGSVKPPAHRASPTTPLSLSFSGESSGTRTCKVATLTRSKVTSNYAPPCCHVTTHNIINNSGNDKSAPPNTRFNYINDDSEKAAGKRSRKKKTLAQLREEEKSLVKERRELNREIMAMYVNLEKQRATNESLKKMKLEFLPHSSVSASVQEESVSGQLMTSVEGYNATSQSSESKFILPDLNMPFEDSSITETAGR